MEEAEQLQTKKKNKKMLAYRILLILLILVLLIYSLFLFFTRQSGAWLSQEGSWVATYETGLLRIGLDTNGNKSVPVAVKLLGGTKFPEQDDGKGDPLFNKMVLPVTIHLVNNGTLDLRGKIELDLPEIGKTDINTADGTADNGILYMVLPKGDALAFDETTDYRAAIRERLGSSVTPDSDYAALKPALTAYNRDALATYTDEQIELQCAKSKADGQADTFDIRILFWADYDQLCAYNNVNSLDFITNDQVLPSWYNFVVHVYTTQIEASPSELDSKQGGE